MGPFGGLVIAELVPVLAPISRGLKRVDGEALLLIPVSSPSSSPD